MEISDFTSFFAIAHLFFHNFFKQNFRSARIHIYTNLLKKELGQYILRFLNARWKKNVNADRQKTSPKGNSHASAIFMTAHLLLHINLSKREVGQCLLCFLNFGALSLYSPSTVSNITFRDPFSRSSPTLTQSVGFPPL